MFSFFNNTDDTDAKEEELNTAIEEAIEAMEELSDAISENLQLAFEFLDLDIPTEE